MKKRLFITIFGFTVSIVLLYLSMRGIEFRKIWSILRQINPFLVPLPLVFIACAICLSAFRWSKVAGSSVRFRDTFTALLIGMFVNNVLPARLGEVARGYVLSHKTKLSFTYSFSTVLLDRFFDLTGLLLMTLLFFPRASLPPRVSQGIYVVIGVVVFCVLMIILMSRQGFANHLAKGFTAVERSFLSRFARRIIEVQENLSRIGSPLTIVFFVIISFCIWFSMSMALWVVTVALGVPVNIRYVPFVCALLNVGISVPSSPGYVGLYQFLLVYLLSIFGVPKYEGFTISVLYHASWYIPYSIVGFALLLREHLRIRDIQKLETEESMD
ncbi:MAG: lysylphosphatidylglycerol synthase transmembrane domain-containing protein [Syntrophorhabdales bacterium]|jgi:uncharacterized protein (TIRG00374 family)